MTQKSDLSDRHLCGALTQFVPPQVAQLIGAVVEAAVPAGSALETTPMPQAVFDIGACARSMRHRIVDAPRQDSATKKGAPVSGSAPLTQGSTGTVLREWPLRYPLHDIRCIATPTRTR